MFPDSESILRFTLQSIVTFSHFNNARGDLLIRMAIYNVYTGTSTCNAGIVLHFSPDFIQQ